MEENNNNIVIYQTDDGTTKIDVKLEDETVWLSQQQMADLYDTTKQNISLHIKNIFDEEELDINSTVKEFLTVQKEGNRKVERKVKYYNLDMILSLGYRIKSKVATNFRRWATERLKEYFEINYKYSTAKRYKESFINIKRELGNYKLSVLTPYILNQALLKLYQTSGTRDSLRNYQKVIKSSLRDATYYFGFIKNNPAGDLEIPRVLSFELKKTI